MCLSSFFVIIIIIIIKINTITKNNNPIAKIIIAQIGKLAALELLSVTTILEYLFVCN